MSFNRIVGQARAWHAPRIASSPSVLIGTCLLPLFAGGIKADPLFGPPAATPVGDHPVAVAIGDLNTDGRPDLLVANGPSGPVTLLLGNGDGTFGAGADLWTGTDLTDVEIADLNLDGKLDVVVASASDSLAAVLLGNGVGGFSDATTFRTGKGPRCVALCDMNRDGRPDLTSANWEEGSVSVLLGRSDGTFGGRTDFTLGGHPAGIVAADFDRDGRVDLAIANQGTDSLTVLLGDGDGSFRARTSYATAAGPWSITVGDLDQDGRPDLAVTGESSSRISVLLGNGDGTFASRTDYPTGIGPMGVAITDANGDGRPDLIAALSGKSEVAVWLGNGDGTFRDGTFFSAGERPRGLAVQDLNSDGQPDLIVTNDVTAGTVSVLLNRTRIPALFGPGTDYAVGGDACGVAVGDLNRDGCEDLVTANSNSNSVSVLYGNGLGGFGFRADFPAGPEPRDVAIGDFDRDGRPDLVTASSSSALVTVLLGDGAGGFGPAIPFTAGSSWSVVTCDLNRDGRLDLVTGGGSVLLGDGAGGFGSPIPTPSSWSRVQIGDLNRDGMPDLVVNRGSTTQSLLGNGDGTFTSRWRSPLDGRDPWINSVALGDVNRDGILDLVYVGQFGWTPGGVHGMNVHLGNGDGTFGYQTRYLAWFPDLIAIADLNVDGRPDLVIDNQVWLGDGLGAFGYYTSLSRAGDYIAIGDFNRDAAPDLALTTCTSTVSVFLNGSLTVPVDIEDFTAASAGCRVHLSWKFSAEVQRELLGVRVQRATASEGPYVETTAGSLEPAESMSWEDADIEPGNDYWYRLVLDCADGSRVFTGPVNVRLSAAASLRTALHQPFEPAGGGPVQIGYSIAGAHTPVRLAIYDARGHELWSLAPAVHEPGEHSQTWDRRDHAGSCLARGVYFVRLEAGSVTASRKLVLVRR